MSCWLPAPRTTSGNAKCIKCIKCIVSLHGNTLGKEHFGPQDLRMSVTVSPVSPVSLLKSTESTHLRHQGPASGSVAAPWKKTTRFHNVFDTKKNVEKKHFWHLKNRKTLCARWKTPVSGPWQCAKLDRRVRAAAWHQPLPVLPNKTFIIWHVQTDMWIKWNAFTLLIRLSCFHNLVSFSPSAVLHFRSFRAAQMFSHLFKAAKVYLQSGRLPEHRHGRMALQNGTILSRHFTFRDKIS